jgi:UDPglucose--hexose-1-phosphate uridylyltransferase
VSRINALKAIEKLLIFARKNKMIEELDIIPCRNSLLDLLGISEPYEENVEEHIEDVTEVLKDILDYASETGIIPSNTVTYRDLLDAKIMGVLMPRQSEMAIKFWNTAKEMGIQEATNGFYALSKASNYIRMDRISKNIYWRSRNEYGELEITINLSKPEKDPEEIAAAKNRTQGNYPKCLLCIENVGYAGHINHPARQNHRIIPINVCGESWYLQYSPYVYYNEHCILLNEKHIPMKISEKTFERLFDFIEQFPHYFIGSNADLPIVGGSILSHDHFQGGRHMFPMEEASLDTNFKYLKYPDVKCGIVKWPMSVIRLSGNNKESLINLSIEILKAWRDYSDKALNILAYTEIGGESIPHNTITPIVRKNKHEEFEIDLVLRNNRTTEKYPEGIFHPHRELHHIKKENIGLIEVMGLAVLPARLNIELKQIEKILHGEIFYEKGCFEESDILYKHDSWIEDLVSKCGTSLGREEAEKYVKQEVGEKFLKVLLDAGVYKRDKEGLRGFIKFLEVLGFQLQDII